MFLGLILDENADQIVHALVLILLSVLIYIEFLSKEAVPVLLKFCLGSFTDHFSFDLHRVLIISGEE